MTNARNWLLFVYKVPSEPTARRVYVWRKLKRLGAVLLHDAVWVLPATAYTREQLQWLAAEINEMSGEALLWESQLLSSGQDKGIIQQFVAQTDTAYSEILAELKKSEADLGALSRRYQQVKAMDYFDSPLETIVRQALMAQGSGATE